MRRPTRLIVVSAVIVALAAACSGGDGASTSTTGGDPPTTAATTNPEAAPPIAIGLITDLTGPFVAFGKDIRTATQLAIDEVNGDGGVNGSMLEVTLIDTGGQPDQAVIGYRELADDGVFAVSGPLSSGEAEVLFTQAPQVQVPIITGTANKEGITDPGDGWALRNTATNTALYTEAMPKWATAYGIESAALVFNEEEPVAAAAAMFAIPAVAEAVGIEIVNADAPITFPRAQTDFSTIVQRVRDTAADGLIVISVPAEAGLLARELARQGETRPILGHPAQAGNTFFEQGGTDINDWVLPSIFDPASDDPLTQAYLAAIAAADEEPPTVPEAANYYDNILLLADAMRSAGIDGSASPDEARSAIRDTLLDVHGFHGVAGEISFDSNGDAMKTVYVNVVRDGELQPLG